MRVWSCACGHAGKGAISILKGSGLELDSLIEPQPQVSARSAAALSQSNPSPPRRDFHPRLSYLFVVYVMYVVRFG